jgi:NAD(P)-dependent dehydrogenase (short-subunit alcohol dehydrogenase family)
MKTDFPDRQFTLHEANIAVADDCRRLVGEVIDQHGRIDILVNNAGITIDRTVAKMTTDDWQTVLDVNLSGAFYLSQAAMRHMLERGTGRNVSISSVIGETGNIGQANYAASRSGLFGLTKSLAKEAAFQLKRAGLLGDGIGLTVNAVAPGLIATEISPPSRRRCPTESGRTDESAPSVRPRSASGADTSAGEFPAISATVAPGASIGGTRSTAVNRLSRPSIRNGWGR